MSFYIQVVFCLQQILYVQQTATDARVYEVASEYGSSGYSCNNDKLKM